MKRLVLPTHAVALFALLAACGTPQEQCIQRNTRDLRTVDRLIAETQGNIDRGYALEEVTILQTLPGFCHAPYPPGPPLTEPVPCLIDHHVIIERAKAIDLAEEAKKLESLMAKRAELAKAAEPVIAQCKAEYPE